jgi:hypothetical protein
MTEVLLYFKRANKTGTRCYNTAQSQPVCFSNVLILAMHTTLTQDYISLHHKAKQIKFQSLCTCNYSKTVVSKIRRMAHAHDACYKDFIHCNTNRITCTQLPHLWAKT